MNYGRFAIFGIVFLILAAFTSAYGDLEVSVFDASTYNYIFGSTVTVDGYSVYAPFGVADFYNLASGYHTLSISASGYSPFYDTVYVYDYCTNYYNAYLQPSGATAYCSLYSYPSQVQVGQYSTIWINYQNLLEQPPLGQITVQCDSNNPGNTAVATGCYGVTGSCAAQCVYSTPGTYIVSATASGTYCLTTTVNVVASDHYVSASADPTTIYGEGDSLVTISYSNFDAVSHTATVDCGNGDASALINCGASSSGSCSTTCHYGVPSSYPQTYTITTSVDGYYAQPVQVKQLSPMQGTLKVYVKDSSNDSPIENAQVNVSSFNGVSVATAYTDSNGYYATSLEDGNYKVTISHSGYETQTKTVSISSGQTSILYFYLAASIQNGTITVNVEDSSTFAPIENASVEILNATSSQIVQTGYTDSSGVFKTEVVSGQYIIRASADNYYTKESNVITVNPGDTQEVYLYLDEVVNPTPSCTITVSPSEIYGAGSTFATVEFTNFDTQSYRNAFVNCGNGNSQTMLCSGEENGSCSTSCYYSASLSYPQYYKITAEVDNNGSMLECAPAFLTQKAPSPSTGTLVVTARNSQTNKEISEAKISVGGEDYYTDEGGTVSITLAEGSYSVVVSKNGYETQTKQVTITAGQTNSLNILLEPVQYTCNSFSMEIVKYPNCEAAALTYQIKVKNNVNDTNTIFLDYSSAFSVEGPDTITLLPYEEQVITVTAHPPADYVGASLAVVSGTDSSGCTQNTELPMCVKGGLSLEVTPSEQRVVPNSRALFKVIVRNRGDSSGQVTLSADGDFPVHFEMSQFNINPYETRTVKLYVNVPSGASGTHEFNINLDSPINDFSANIYVTVPNSNYDFYSDFSGCPKISKSTKYYKITFTNDAIGGDYMLSTDDDLGVSLSQHALLNFIQGTQRSVYLYFDSSRMTAGEHQVVLTVRKGASVVYQQGLCFDVEGESQTYAQLSPTSLALNKMDSETAILKVQNNGNSDETYEVSTSLPFSTISLSDNSFSLAPGEEKDIEIYVNPAYSTDSGVYNVKVKLYHFVNGNRRIVGTYTLVVSVLGAQSTPPSSVQTEIDGYNVAALPINGETLVSATVKNTGSSTASSVQLDASNLPSGVSVSYSPSEDISPFSEKVLQLKLKATNALSGNYTFTLKAIGPNSYTEKEATLSIIQGGNAAISVLGAAPEYKSASESKLVFVVTNNGKKTQTIKPEVKGLPDGWEYSIDPTYSILYPDSSQEFTIKLKAKDYNEKAYSGVFQIENAEGAVTSTPFSVDLKKAKELSGSSGLFALGSLSLETALLTVVIILVVIGGVLLYLQKKNAGIAPSEGELAEGDSSEN